MMAEQPERRPRGGRVMIEFILIVVVLLLLIGIFVRREVFK
jgi:Flp pilus assembly protein TadG